jgi:uncharacterized protein (TIGR03118 family)
LKIRHLLSRAWGLIQPISCFAEVVSMSWSSPFRRPFFRPKQSAPDRLRRYRPVLEGLEDRHLLSGGFSQVNLASDVPGLARVTDPNLVNPWGIAFSPTGPFWFADNGSGVADILDGRGQPVSLVVPVPPGAVTGTVFNATAGFVISENGAAAPSRFLFATEDGTISGWSAVVDPTRALLAVDNSSSGAVYKGLAIAADPSGQSLLYAADFGRGTIDVFDQHFRPAALPGSFQDPTLPAGYAPFNIQTINNQLFVTYAQQNGNRSDDIPGAGHGFIDIYDTEGRLLTRFASQGPLNSPWGLALAPGDFGSFGGTLLVANNGDGRINAYDPRSGRFVGQLADDNGIPIAISRLWALSFGNGHDGGDAHTLFFAAGVDDEAHGLFGAIQGPERRGADTGGLLPFDPHAPGEPGDYPLPPSGGPALRDKGQDSQPATAVLLPLMESSLVLIPTLTTLPPPEARIEAAGLVSPVGASSWPGPVSTAIPANDGGLLVASGGRSRPASAAPNGAVALRSFLDLNPLPDVPQEEGGGQRPASSLHEVSERSLAPADGGADDLLIDVYALKPEVQTNEEQGPGTVPGSSQKGELLEEVSSEKNPASAEARAAGNERVVVWDHSGWTNLIKLLFVGSITVIWTYTVGAGTVTSRLSTEFQGEEPKRAREGRLPRPGESKVGTGKGP